MEHNKDRTFNPVADLFPFMPDDEFALLKRDIAENGQHDPIWLHPDGSVIDGRHRYRACRELNIEPKFATWDGNGSLLAFVVSLNLHRRHLTSSQRACVALEVLPMLEAEAKERQGARNDLQNIPEKVPECSAGESRDAAAALLNTNPRYVSDAKKLKEQSPEMFEQVRAGKLAIKSAVQQAVGGKQTDNHRAKGTGDNEWYTPHKYVEMARRVMGAIDLDPASNAFAQQTIKAATHYTAETDGLAQQWEGNVWLNPPYTQPHIAQFCQKLASEVESGRVSQAILLTHNYTDTKWFHRAASACQAICFTAGRIGFVASDGRVAAPTQGQAFFYYGENVQRFREVFSECGLVVARI